MALTLSLVLILSLCLVAAAPAIANGYDVNDGESIQLAINSASSGDTITVGPGTYQESVTIDKDLKLIAPDGATIQAPTTPEDVYLAESSPKYHYAVGLLGGIYNASTDTVEGTDTITVELSGFTIDANNYIPTGRWASILVRNVNDVSGTSSINQNELINILVDGKETFGILGYGDLDVIISENEINGFARGGIGIMSGYVEVINNVVTGPGLGVPVTWAPNGIQVGRGASGLIQGNDVSGCGWPGTDWAGTGVLVVDTSNVEVNDNWVHSNEQGIGVVDFPVEFYGPNWPGVISDVSVTRNMLTDNAWGITVANDCTNITVAYNCIRDTLGDSIDVYTYNIYYGDLGILPPTNVDVNYNSIIGSGYDGLWVGPYVTETVNAVNNWWGDSSGPSGDGPGSGDTVIGNADYNPWIMSLTYTGSPQPNNNVILEAELIGSDSVGIPNAEIEFYLDILLAGMGTTDENGVATCSVGSLPVDVYDVVARMACLQSEAVMLAIYDPTAGFVTGGGWIDSPAGALKRVWDQGFENNTDGWFDSTDEWYGSITQVPSGTDGITSSQGAYHAIVEGDVDSAPFSRFDGYRDTWTGTWTAEIDVYLDPSWTLGQGFDYSVAASGSDGAHQRDYIFHVTKDTSTGDLMVAGSNNTNFAPREDLENINHYVVTTAGWYTLQHVFYESSGALAVDLNLLDSDGNVLFIETRYTAADTLPTEVGGNRYAWFTFVSVDAGIAVDEHQLYIPNSVSGKATFGFVAKYNKKTKSAEGNTEFIFKAGDLNFHSSSYDWLVVDKDDSRAQFKGTGTINGTGEYKFMLWADDGEPDTLRMKIWEEDELGNETVVYDNGSDQAISGGSIIVHTSKK